MKNKQRSLQYKFLLPTSCTIIVQVVLTLVTFSAVGVFSSIQKTAINSFKNNADSKSFLVNDYFKSFYNLPLYYENLFTLPTSITAKEFEGYSYDQQIAYTVNYGTKLLDLIKGTEANGAFFIFNNDGTGDNQTEVEKIGLYIRKNGTDLSSLSSFIAERGPTNSVLKKLGLDRDSYQSNYYNSLTDDLSFFSRPYQAANDNSYIASKISDFGYWSDAFQLHKDDAYPIMTYSLPLLDYQGKPYGAIGLELKLKDLEKKFLNYESFSSSSTQSQVTLCKVNESNYSSYLYSSGSLLKNQNFHLTIKDGIFHSSKYKLYGNNVSLNAYNQTGYFSNENLYVMTTVKESYLLSSVNKINTIIYTVIIFLGLVELIAISFLLRFLINPISKISKEIVTSDPSLPLHITKSNIREIDSISSAIEESSSQSYEILTRFSRVLSSINVQVGLFFYKKNDKDVYCTPSLGILLFQEEKKSNFYMQHELFYHALNQIRKECYNKEENIFFYMNHYYQIHVEEKEDHVNGFIIDFTSEVLSRQKIEQERDTDSLTGLKNRQYFMSYIERISSKYTSYGIVMIDLDNLKRINDAYGHSAGDNYIICFAKLLSKHCIGDVLGCRRSGDEFLIFVPLNTYEKVYGFVNELQKDAISFSFTSIDSKVFHPKFSTGIAMYPEDSNNLETLVKFADFAMYQVKRKNKGDIHLFSQEEFNKNSLLEKSKDEMKSILNNNDMLFAFQPIVSAIDGSIYAYEALMRIKGTYVTNPTELIHLSKIEQCLQKVEDATFINALKTYQHLLNNSPKLFINSIPNVSMSDEVQKKMTVYKELLSRCVVEFLEIEQIFPDTKERKMDFIKKNNCQVAIDDFGAGYNGDITLLTLESAYLKIDRSIITDCDKDKARQLIIDRVCEAAHLRNIKVIAEGVETKEELNTVIMLGADYIQGFYVQVPDFHLKEINKNIVEDIVYAHKSVQKELDKIKKNKK